MTGDRVTNEAPDVDRLIAETKFSGYQRITLPSGRVIPGTDRSPTARLVYPADLTGKSVLDVGCYYGFFLHEAIRRGARRAAGIEADPERFRIASTLATLWDGKVDVYEGLLEDVELTEKFDVVLFLNVLHHVKDPLPVMKRLAGLCRGTLIVEFRQPHDSQFIQDCFHKDEQPGAGRSLVRRMTRRVRTAVETRLMERLTRRLPIVGVGSVEYHRSYFFSQAGFRNRGQALAICDCLE